MTKQTWYVYRSTFKDKDKETYQIFDENRGTLAEARRSAKLLAKERNWTLLHIDKVDEYVKN